MKPNVRKCEIKWRAALEGESISVGNTREKVWRKMITSNNEEKRGDEPEMLNHGKAEGIACMEAKAMDHNARDIWGLRIPTVRKGDLRLRVELTREAQTENTGNVTPCSGTSVVGPRNLEEKTFPRSRRIYKIHPLIAEYLQSGHIWTAATEAGAIQELVKTRIKVEAEYEDIKGIGRTARRNRGGTGTK